ncbi:hypothetical protein EHF33_10770 [Deinococcus psychrotolerans]|uniref:Uncharacterized protein n=1 Tax=Deinococcus psychrotolerans TaxID=2489213 RepID=A0A3G8YNJ4_9DEIO|nr:hypothetical protein [Deinococcus psychrotolerans]AZI43161.1 hypothetical protein EHF33_10770 [Deinococcus psychrotolerans]
MTPPSNSPNNTAASTAGKPVAAADRARLDQVFMQVMLDVQAQAQQSRPPQAGNLAAMFHKEQVSEALQGCAMLIAGWNQNRIDNAGTTRAARAFRALELPELAGRIEQLHKIDEG